MSGLPTGWVEVAIGDVCRVVGGSTPKTSVDEYWDGPIPWVTPDDLSKDRSQYVTTGRRSISQAGYDSCSTQMLPPGSVLYTSRAPIGYVAIARNDLCTNQGFKSFVLPERLDSRFVYWQLIWATPMIKDLGSGTTFKEISGKVAGKIPLRVAPRAEQDRIVAAIEEQFSRLDAAEASLQRAKRNVERMRRAVLAEAFPRGDELPTGWVETTIGSVISPAGERSTPGADDARHYIGLEHIEAHTTRILGSQLASQIRSSAVSFQKDSVLYGRMRPYLNKVCLAPFDGIGSPELIVLPPSLGIRPRFLLYRISHTDFVSFAMKHIEGDRPRVKWNQLADFPIDLPPVAEQDRIVAAIEEQFSILDSLFAAIDHSLVRSAHLRRAILEQAFTGRLVPQNPSDEPASALLERIEQVRRDNLAASKTKKGKVATPR